MLYRAGQDFPRAGKPFLAAYFIFSALPEVKEGPPQQLWDTKAFCTHVPSPCMAYTARGRCLPEITSLGNRAAMNLLSVSGVRIAAVFPSMLPMPSISSMMK